MELELLKITSIEGDVRVEINGDVLDIIHALAVVAHQSPHFIAMMKTAIQLANEQQSIFARKVGGATTRTRAN
jgi:hypothetical protein